MIRKNALCFTWAVLAVAGGCSAPVSMPPDDPLAVSSANPTAEFVGDKGFRLRPPEGWTLMPAEQAYEAGRAFDWNDDELNATRDRGFTDEPLLYLVSDPSAISASIKVGLAPVKLSDLSGVSQDIGATIRHRFAAAVDVGPLKRRALGGLEAEGFTTRLIVEYVVAGARQQLELLGEVWLIYSGDDVFLVAHSRPADDHAGLAAWEAALDSIQIGAGQ